MKTYQSMRISINGIPTYGDKYVQISSEKDLKYNDIIEIKNAKYIILFEED